MFARAGIPAKRVREIHGCDYVVIKKEHILQMLLEIEKEGDVLLKEYLEFLLRKLEED